MLQPSNEGWGNSTIGRPPKKEMTMGRIILTAALLGGFFALSASEAGAVVCARGVPRRLRRAARRGGDASRLLPPPLSLSRRSGHLPVGQKSYRTLGIGYPAPR